MAPVTLAPASSVTKDGEPPMCVTSWPEQTTWSPCLGAGNDLDCHLLGRLRNRTPPHSKYPPSHLILMAKSRGGPAYMFTSRGHEFWRSRRYAPGLPLKQKGLWDSAKMGRACPLNGTRFLWGHGFSSKWRQIVTGQRLGERTSILLRLT